jgi:hypothetical protein
MMILVTIIKMLVATVTLNANAIKWILNELEQTPAKYSHYWRYNKKNRLDEGKS